MAPFPPAVEMRKMTSDSKASFEKTLKGYEKHMQLTAKKGLSKTCFLKNKSKTVKEPKVYFPDEIVSYLESLGYKASIDRRETYEMMTIDWTEDPKRVIDPDGPKMVVEPLPAPAEQAVPAPLPPPPADPIGPSPILGSCPAFATPSSVLLSAANIKRPFGGSDSASGQPTPLFGPPSPFAAFSYRHDDSASKSGVSIPSTTTQTKTEKK